MLTGRRIRVIGGPWPERVGCLGNVMIPSAGEARIYPFHGKSKHEEVIRLDADPLLLKPQGDFGRTGEEGWTCVIARTDIDSPWKRTR